MLDKSSVDRTRAKTLCGVRERTTGSYRRDPVQENTRRRGRFVVFPCRFDKGVGESEPQCAVRRPGTPGHNDDSISCRDLMGFWNAPTRFAVGGPRRRYAIGQSCPTVRSSLAWVLDRGLPHRFDLIRHGGPPERAGAPCHLMSPFLRKFLRVTSTFTW